MKSIGRAVCVGLAVIALLAGSLITPAVARYSNIDSVVTTYGNTAAYLTAQTLTPDKEIYDFGVYDHEADAVDFAHVVRIAAAEPVAGVLRFSWDDITRSEKDVSVYIDHDYYVSSQNSGYTDYTVAADSPLLEIPFSLMFSTVTVTRLAELNVSWYPQGSDEPTLFACYLVALVGKETPHTVPTFEDTVCITDRLLQVSVTTPADSAGVFLTTAEGDFAAGTRYCGAYYSDGATLLRDSAIFVPRTADNARLYLDLSAHRAVYRSVTLQVGVSDTLYSEKVCTPPAETALTVSLSDGTGVLSADRPLTIRLTESAAFRDSDWSHNGDTVDLRLQIFRRVDGSLLPVTAGEHFTTTVTQTDVGGTVTITTPDGKQPAGTYVLVVTQYYYGYPVLKMPVWFFIDYR